MKKRIATLLLVLLLVIGLLPMATFATEANDVVYISVSYDGQFKTASDGSNMAYVPVELSKLKEIDLDAYNMGDYKYDADGDGTYEVTALHLYIYAQEKLMGLKWADVQASGAAGSIFFETGLFGFPDANLNYYYNGTFPVDEKMSADWGYTVGATADHIVLKNGDCLDVAGFSNDSWMIYSATFRYFTIGDKVIRAVSTPKGEALSVKLGSIGRDWSTNEAVLNAEIGATICYSQTPFDADAATVTTDENGNATISFDKVGKWYIWSMGYNDGMVSCSPAYMEVNVTWKNTSDVTSHWHNFRNSYVNMALTDAKTPMNAETTAMKWAVKLGTGWNANPSVQIIVDDALVVMIGKVLYKLDLQTGEVLQQADMTAAPNFGYTPCTYADGLIFCPLSGGIIQAFDAKTLESVWVYKDEKGGQSLSPITYNDGCVYTGFWNGENKDANYVCVNVSDGSLVWNKTVTGGFYWAGSVVLGDNLIVGTDDGDRGYAGDSKLYSLNKKDGSVISELTLTGCGDQRSSIAYSEEKGRIYFTAKNGYLCSAKVDAATGELSDLLTSKQANQCTSTPVVYGDHVYFSCGSGVVMGSGGNGNFVVADADTLQQHYAVALQAYPQGSVLVSEAYLAETGKLYCYSTYNGYPGGLTLIKVDPTVNTADGAELIELFAPAEEYQQYCITSPICGPDGTIYYKNDSGYVFAVGTNNAYLTNLDASVGTFTEGFSASKLSYELVVPVGTNSVTLTPTACDGGKTNAVAVTLVDGVATAEITVTKDGDQRTYTVSVRTVSTDATLGSLKVNETNSYGGSVNPDFSADVHYYAVLNAGAKRSFVNVWPDAADSHATVKVFPLSNATGKKTSDIGEDGAFVATATNQGHKRYAIYFVDDSQPMAVRIEVTSENGEIANYYLVISKEAAAEDGAALLESLENCAHDDRILSGNKEPTCTEPGYTGDLTCNFCGIFIPSQQIDALPHNYKVEVVAPTCTEGGCTLETCVVCDHTVASNRVAALGHDWENATCANPKTCKGCGQTEGIALGHAYTSAVIAPTCSEVGYTRYTCSVCNDSYTDSEVAALGHSWDEGVVTLEPAEGVTGEKTFTCTACKETRTEEIPALEHTHAYTSVVTAPTCTEEGYTTYTCACGDTYVDSKIAALGHSWDEGKVTKEPSETEDGEKTFTCTACKETRTEGIPALDHTHTYTSVVTAPTCTEEGYTTYTCACGDTYVDAKVAAVGHTWTDATCTAPKSCSVCAAVEGQASGHAYEAGICTACGEADPDYKTAEGDVEIYVTIAHKGNVVLFQQLVTVLDVNHNGIFDVDDALYAAHEACYEGGAAAGYSAYESQWGLSIGMLWGDTSQCYGYWLNNASCWSLEDTVADGNHLVAFVYADSEYWSDAYSKFDSFTASATAGSSVTVKLEKAGYDENWNTVFSAYAGATITVYDSEGKILTEGYTVTDNGDGSYSITFQNAGSYCVVATGSNLLTVPAVCQVTVQKGTEIDPSPSTGDIAMFLFFVAAISVSGLAVLMIGKKKSI